MLRKLLLALGAGVAFCVANQVAFANDRPLRAPTTAAQSSGMYVFTNGSYESIKMPTYDLGFRLVAPGAADGPAASFDKRLSGYGLSGGVGFVLPNGFFLSSFGHNARIEFGGAYGHSTGSQTSAYSARAIDQLNMPQLNGFSGIGLFCGSVCTSTGNLKTSYTSWQASGKFLTDYQVNRVTLTPSLKVFGGKSRNNQTLSETVTFVGGPATASYDADTTLKWTDWGSRLGLKGSVPVTDGIVFSIGGDVGLAARQVSLSGSDAASISFGPGSTVTAITTDARTTAFVANAETSLLFKLASSLTMRAFAGLNYDNKVPGVAQPGIVPGGGTSTPAGIKYQAETSYYAGGGLTLNF